MKCNIIFPMLVIIISYFPNTICFFKDKSNLKKVEATKLLIEGCKTGDYKKAKDALNNKAFINGFLDLDYDIRNEISRRYPKKKDEFFRCDPFEESINGNYLKITKLLILKGITKKIRPYDYNYKRLNALKQLIILDNDKILKNIIDHCPKKWIPELILTSLEKNSEKVFKLFCNKQNLTTQQKLEYIATKGKTSIFEQYLKKLKLDDYSKENKKKWMINAIRGENIPIIYYLINKDFINNSNIKHNKYYFDTILEKNNKKIWVLLEPFLSNDFNFDSLFLNENSILLEIAIKSLSYSAVKKLLNYRTISHINKEILNKIYNQMIKLNTKLLKINLDYQKLIKYACKKLSKEFHDKILIISHSSSKPSSSSEFKITESGSFSNEEKTIIIDSDTSLSIDLDSSLSNETDTFERYIQIIKKQTRVLKEKRIKYKKTAKRIEKIYTLLKQYEYTDIIEDIII